MLCRRLTLVTPPALPLEVSLFPENSRLVDINHRSESQMVASMIYAESKHTRVHPVVLVYQHDGALSMARERAQDASILVLLIKRGADSLFITDSTTDIWLNGKAVRSAGTAAPLRPTTQ